MKISAIMTGEQALFQVLRGKKNKVDFKELTV